MGTLWNGDCLKYEKNYKFVNCFVFLDKELFLKNDILYKITEGSLYWMLGLGVVNSIMISMEYWRNVFEKGDKNE